MIKEQNINSHLVTPTNVVALKDHRRIIKIELIAQSSVGVVPVLTRNFAALTRLRGATRKEKITLTFYKYK